MLDDFVAGAVTGLTLDLAFYPLDTVKTRIQSRQGILANGGSKHLYRGVGANLIGCVPASGAYFAVYEGLKHHGVPLISRCIDRNPNARDRYRRDAVEASMRLPLAASSEMMAGCIRVPLDMVKQQVQALQHRNLWSAAVHVWHQGGLRAFYSGYRVTMYRDVPFSTLQFPLYDWLNAKSRLSAGTPNSAQTQHAAHGFIAGAFAAGATTPFDVVKTRVMLHGRITSGTSSMQMLRSIVREEGSATLFRGLQARVTMMSLGGAVQFSTFERVKAWMKDDLEQSDRSTTSTGTTFSIPTLRFAWGSPEECPLSSSFVCPATLLVVA